MTTPLDLILLPLYRQDGQDKSEMPGLYAAKAPRRASRGRSQDRLVIHLELRGTAPLSPKGYQKLIRHLADTYYKTTGSATAAMRTVAEWLNQYLLERNLRGANRGMQAVGLLTLAVLRGDRLYLAQSGPTHAFLIAGEGLQSFHDPDIAGRGLGLGRATTIQYRQIEIQPQDSLLISADPPPTWTTSVLNGLRGLSLMKQHVRLIQQVGPELQAGMLRVQEGTGKLRILRPETPRTRSRPEPPKTETARPGEDTQAAQAPAKAPETAAQPQNPAPDEIPPLQEKPLPDQSPAAIVTAPAEDKEQPSRKTRRERFIGPAVLKIGQAVGDTLKQVSRASGELVKRMLPDESLLNLPNSMMIFIAVAVPLVVVAVAVSVYFKRGRGKMYAEFYLQAQYAAEQAIQLEDAGELRSSWSSVLAYLDQAEEYQVTEDSQNMRNYALAVLDNLDYVVRLQYQPAIISGPPGDLIVEKILVSTDDNDLYLLDGNDGQVIHATLTDQGYEVDPDFVCGPVRDDIIVSELIDILLLPLNDDDRAVVMGMDANGNLLKCMPGGQPPSALQMPVPRSSWGNPIAFLLDNNSLYVLDTMFGAWYFRNQDYSDSPRAFFDDEGPERGDAVDFTVSRGDLYLLHENGQISLCTLGNPTRCTDPAIINDLRDGKESGPTIDEAVFTQIQFGPPPDPSIFLFDPETVSIYHLSLRLTYQRQYRPQYNLPDGEATAFAISPNHQAFIAVGNQVYYAALP